MTTTIATMVAEVGFLGRIPFAPGTWGSVFGAALYYFVIQYIRPLDRRFELYMLVFIFVLGLWSIRQASSSYRTSTGIMTRDIDSPSFVIDEVFGYCFSMYLLPISFFSLFWCFFWFRVFDIVKPFPISWLDKMLKTPSGVMLDDAFAGALAHMSYISFFS